jgi:type I restriction enzyme R subunit
MVFFSQNVHRKLEGNFTFLIITDREDLDKQIYTTFSGCGIVDNDRDKCRASSGVSLMNLLTQDKQYVFTMIHKFNQDVDPSDPYSKRDDIIVISDEAHRTQYGRLALNMRNALPNAHYIGFTGTPLFKNDELTKRIFGDYVSTYDFQRAVDDNATVPLYYDNRGEKLKITTPKINERIAEKLEEIELDEDRRARLEEELGRDYHILTAKKRLNAIARDFAKHYSVSWETGKAMFICIDKITTVRMYNLIQKYWNDRIVELEKNKVRTEDEQEFKYIENQIQWMKETKMAVVISEEQGEVDKFRKWDLDILPHRELIKKGFETSDGKRIDVETAFKKPEHPFRIVFVCAMWLTGFDVECLTNMYLDKPLKAHTLMQAIARANRVYEGKNNGLIVDYCGILKGLREALAEYAVGSGNTEGGDGTEGIDPVKSDEELIEVLKEAIDLTKEYLKKRGFELSRIVESKGFDKNAAIRDAKEVVNQSEETRKRFEILAREVFKKFKACLTIVEINNYRKDNDAIDIVYKKLQGDKIEVDISDIIKELHTIVDEAITPAAQSIYDKGGKIYDISKIDFEKLKEEFQKSHKKNTTVQCLKNQVERRLDLMLQRNPLRLDYHKRYQEIIAEYNKEKDRITIEDTFAELLKFIDDLDEEDRRAMREGLSEEDLALFDLICKPDLKPKDRNRIKNIARQLLDNLKDEKLRIDNWREKESTKAEVKTFIHDFLWDDTTGLPVGVYSPEEVNEKTEIVFDHIFRQYQDAEHHIYAAA